MVRIARFVVIFIFIGVGAVLNAQACIVSSYPIEATDFSQILKIADRIETVELICEDCIDEQFLTLNFRNIENGAGYEIEGYIFAIPQNTVTVGAEFFDPWRLWGRRQFSCSMVPVVIPAGYYDVAIVDEEIVWLDRHDPYLMGLGVDEGPNPKLTPTFLWELAADTFRHATIFWTCGASEKRELFISDANFKAYDAPLPEHMTRYPGACGEDADARGIVLLDDKNRVFATWHRAYGRLGGTRIQDKDANHAFSIYMLSRLNGRGD